MFQRSICVCLLSVCLAGAAFAQSPVGTTTTIPMIVEEGFPLQVLLVKKLQFKEKESVRGIVIEPVYAFDREVIPSGTQIEGTIVGFQKIGKWKRISAILGGNFTPLHNPVIAFQTLVLPGGTRMPIETFVVSGTEKVVRSDNQHARALTNPFASTVKKPDERLKNLLWGLSPYRPQYLPTGSRLSAVLLRPLDFGAAIIETETLDAIGTEPPADSVVSVRLTTALDSRTVQHGVSVETVLTRPLFSQDHRLIFPVGSRLSGKVTEADPARARHRNGQLAFTLNTIALPDSWPLSTLHPRAVEANLRSIRVTHEMKDLRIDETGTTRISESKKRFIAPAWAFIKSGRAINSTAEAFDQALLGSYRNKFLKQVTGGSGSGLGIPASISGAMFPPVGISLSFYGAARSVYSTFLGRGRDIVLPMNTSMEIQLGK